MLVQTQLRKTETDAGAAAPAPPGAPATTADLPSNLGDRPRRRRVLISVAAVAALGIAAASVLGPAQPARLVVRTTSQTAVVDPASGEVIASGTTAESSADGSTLVTTSRVLSGGTQVHALETRRGTPRWSRFVTGHLQVRLVSQRGDMAVLARYSDLGAKSAYLPTGRARTLLTVASAASTRTYPLEGNFEPEAISLDGSSVFVIQYTPPRAPTSYQVRRLDLASGKVVDVYTPDAELQERMRGTARTQVASEDGRRLYTLYTLGGSSTGAHAFVHVLSLDGLWAHCIDLPEQFSGDAELTAMALSDDGTRLHVLDNGVGRMAELDTEGLRVLRTERFAPRELATSAVALGDSLYVPDLGDLVELDRSSGDVIAVTPGSSQIVDLALGPQGLIYVATTRSVRVFDADTGTVVRTFSPPAGENITGIGATGVLSPDLASLQCAC